MALVTWWRATFRASKASKSRLARANVRVPCLRATPLILHDIFVTALPNNALMSAPADEAHVAMLVGSRVEAMANQLRRTTQTIHLTRPIG